MASRLRAAVVIGAIALASGIAGAAIDRMILVRRHRSPRESRAGTPEQYEARRRAEIVERMSKGLSLTSGQRLAIDSVIQWSDSSLRAIRLEVQPRTRQVLERSRSEIAARLDSVQRAKYARISAERDRRRGRGSR